MDKFFKNYLNELGRPMEVYAELYGRAQVCEKKYNKKEANSKQGFIISLAVAFFIVTGFSTGFRVAENALKQTALGKHESVVNLIQTESREFVPEKYKTSDEIPSSGLLRNAILQYVAEGARMFFGVETVNAATSEYAGSLALASPDIELLPGERQLIRLKYTNEGSYNWRRTSRSFVSLYARPVNKKSNAFHDVSWMGSKQVARITDSLVGPGRVGFVEFYIKAPQKLGEYTEKFQLAAEDTAWVQGSEVMIKVRVVKEKTAASEATSEDFATSTQESRESFPVNLWSNETQDVITNTQVLSTLPVEQQTTSTPIIRVGLYRTDEPVEFVSDNEYEIRDEQNNLYGQIAQGQLITLAYNTEQKIYSARSGNAYVESVLPLRLTPRTGNAGIFTLSNLTNFLARNKKINYNQFVGLLEIRYASGHIWVVNELSIEQYLNGLAEGGEGAPMEFLKALAVAARSFAYDAIRNPIKHPKQGFHVDAEYDQIYKGAVRANLNPSWVSAVESTNGQVVTYKNEPVTTPYFAQSSGRTLAWSEVWRGKRSWLISVKTPYDNGRKRLGHGVGMSNHDALLRAKKGVLAEEILKYYYRNTDLQKMW